MMSDAPATPGQLRFFLLGQQDSRVLVQHVTIDGSVSPTRLRVAIADVLSAQPSLRTELVPTEEGLRQRVHPPQAVPVEFVDDSDLPGQLAAAAAPFTDGPLTRVIVLVGATRSHCLFGVHHAVFDEESSSILTGQLMGAYHSLETVAAAPVITGAPADRAAVAYWQRTLRDCPADTRLPQAVDAPGNLRATHRVPIGRELQERLRAQARNTGATPFPQLLAALSWVISWYSDRDDVVLATVAGLRDESTLQTIGCMQNTVPLRFRLAGLDTATLVQHAVEVLFDSVDHARLPLEDILTQAGVRRLPGRKPLTQILCTQATIPTPRTVDGLTWQLDIPPADHAEFELSVTLCHDTVGEMWLAFEHQADVVDAATVRRLGEHLLVALEALQAPGPLGAPLSVAEQVELSALQAARPFWERFADRQGNAVQTDTDTLSYPELDSAVDGLAAALIEAGVRPGDRVGVHLPRTADLVISLLAVWRAGAAYVPLDPEYPAERLRYMVQDAEPAALISQDTSLQPGVTIVPPHRRASDPPAWPVPDPTGLAYLIYTSGTTGRPKGVMVRHDNLTALFASFNAEFVPPQVTIAATSLSFDISALEIFWPLSLGRTIRLTSHRDVAQTSIADGALYQCTPTVARILSTDAAGRALLAGLSTLLIGGEPLPRDLADVLLDLVPGPVYNCYGPTETTVWTTVWRVRPNVPIQIGRPLLGETAFIVDGSGRALPPGCPGRLVLSGAGVGAGYWRRPELTAERFTSLGYDTGDLAVYRDGSLHFLSRADTQVKLMGQRIELAEIETTLHGHPIVRQAATAVTGSGTAIAAYLVIDGPADGVVEILRKHLDERLTPAMIPQYWQIVAALPQLPNGKLDRAALAELAADFDSPVATSSAAGGVCLVTEVWEKVLSEPVTDLDATFFDLGGNSAGIVRVYAALSTQHPALSAADLFRHTTARALGAHLTRLAAPTPTTPARADLRGAKRAGALAGWQRKGSQ